jgi:protein gp37
MGVSIENKRWVERADYLREVPSAVRFISAEPLIGPLDGLDLDGIDWLIAGGESGHRHRPLDEEWAIELRDLCRSEGVAFFFKQWGGRHAKANGRMLQGREWSEMPTPRARELPVSAGELPAVVGKARRGPPCSRSNPLTPLGSHRGCDC